METSKEYILKYARMGIKIYSDFINKKNENNELYYYECLASINEFAPYDMMIQKHDVEDWGNYTTTYHEIKLRENTDINEYETSVIDASKIQQLQRISFQTNNRCFINVIYPKNRIICQWEIEPDMSYTTTNKEVIWNSRSEMEHKQVKLNKLLVELPISEAKKFRY